MKRISALTLVGTMACLTGCATGSPEIRLSEAVGPAPGAASEAGNASTLQVYSARQRQAYIDVNLEEFRMNNDFGRNDFLYEAAPGDYTICTADGQVLRRVHNSRNSEDETPAVVNLAPGRYTVLAQARDLGTVEVPIVVEPGKRTVVNLQRYRRIADTAEKTELVWLPGSMVVGWKAAENGKTHS